MLPTLTEIIQSNAFYLKEKWFKGHIVFRYKHWNFRLKKDLQDCNDQKEVGYIHMKKKHAQEIAELNEIIATNSKTMQK